jgi:hypothetical protein
MRVYGGCTDPESGSKYLSCWFALCFPAPCLTVLHGFRRLTLPYCCQVFKLERVCGWVYVPASEIGQNLLQFCACVPDEPRRGRHPIQTFPWQENALGGNGRGREGIPTVGAAMRCDGAGSLLTSSDFVTT